MKSGNTIVAIDGALITDEDSLHTIFQEMFGFPGFYGRNWNAWIDCMSYLDDPASEMTSTTVATGCVVVLHIDNARAMKERCRPLLESLVECASFVNWRRIENGQEPVLAMSFYS